MRPDATESIGGVMDGVVTTGRVTATPLSPQKSAEDDNPPLALALMSPVALGLGSSAD